MIRDAVANFFGLMDDGSHYFVEMKLHFEIVRDNGRLAEREDMR